MNTLYRDFLCTFLGIVVGATLIANGVTYLAMVALVITLCLVGMVIFIGTNLAPNPKLSISMNCKKLAITLLSVFIVVGLSISGLYFISLLPEDQSMYSGIFTILLIVITLVIIMPMVSLLHDTLIHKIKE